MTKDYRAVPKPTRLSDAAISLRLMILAAMRRKG